MDYRNTPGAVNFRDFLIYRYANADLAKENDHCARLAYQLLNDTTFNVEAFSRYSNFFGPKHKTQYDALWFYCSRHPEYAWCLSGELSALFVTEIELAWIEYDKWLSGLVDV